MRFLIINFKCESCVLIFSSKIATSTISTKTFSQFNCTCACKASSKAFYRINNRTGGTFRCITDKIVSCRPLPTHWALNFHAFNQRAMIYQLLKEDARNQYILLRMFSCHVRCIFFKFNTGIVIWIRKKRWL